MFLTCEGRQVNPCKRSPATTQPEALQHSSVMTKNIPVQAARFAFLLCLSIIIESCGSRDNHAPAPQNPGTVCAILAHPDDETIISGTLAKLSDQGFKISVIYVTSGDEGPDETGRGLHRNKLAEVRETEAMDALRSIGIETPPVFLRYPDGGVQENFDSVRQELITLLDEVKPQIVIGFGPDGITGSWDHRYTGKATDLAFDQTGCGRLLLHMAITKPLSPFYANGVAVPKRTVDVRVNVSGYFNQRIKAVESHKTQFNKGARSAYRLSVRFMRNEKYIIARKRNADTWFESGFTHQSPGPDTCHDQYAASKPDGSL